MLWRRGDVVLVDFPFVDRTGSKHRPALVISGLGFHKERSQDTIVAVISTKIDKYKGKSDGLLEDWQKAGLTHPSVVRSTILTILSARINRRVGKLSNRDLTAVWERLRFSLQL